jgi:TRAP-type C4-dicarboxylate transport system permease small subunit
VTADTGGTPGGAVTPPRPGGDPLRSLRRALTFFDLLATGMAYLAGMALLVASFYITVDVLGRKFVGVSSMVTDEFGGYALALGGIWALAFALTTGAHVRIDVLLPYLPRRLRAVLNHLALVAMVFFAAVVAFYTWKLARGSFQGDARAQSFLRTPRVGPPVCLALGFTLLAAHGLLIFLVGFVESLRGGRFAEFPVLRIEDLTEGL